MSQIGVDAQDLRECARAHQVLAMASIGGEDHDDVLVIQRTSGIRLWDVCGNEFIDGMSGLTNVNTGYGREELAEVAAEVLRQLGPAPGFYGLTHKPAVELADRLASITPGGLERFLFTVGGSDAVDSAIKIARRVQALRGWPEKNVIIGREQSYHGMTLGALSAMAAESYRTGFGPLAPGFVHIPQPKSDDALAADELDRVIRRLGPEHVAAFIAEPISLPTGIMLPPAGYWPRVQEICRDHDVLFILDEVVTGFGRTGRMFAAEHWNLRPDLLVMAKGIAGGYMPMGAVGMTNAVWQVAVQGHPFFHGFTSGGHAAGCAVALRNIEIIEREGLVARARTEGAQLRDALEGLRSRLNLSAVRGIGMLAGLDVVPPDARTVSAREWLGTQLPRLLRRRGLLIRQYSGTTMLAPSLAATHADLSELVGRLEVSLREILSAAPPFVRRACLPG